MKRKNNALALSAAILLAVCVAGGLFKIYASFDSLRHMMDYYDSGDYYIRYQCWLIFSSIIGVAGEIIMMIALFMKTKKQLPAIGFIVLAVGTIVEFSSVMMLQLNMQVNAFAGLSILVGLVPLLAYVFMAISIFVISAKPGKPSGIRTCWFIGPTILSVINLISIVIRYGSVPVGSIHLLINMYSVMNFLVTSMLMVAYFLAMCWFSYANLELPQPVQPLQPGNYYYPQQ